MNRVNHIAAHVCTSPVAAHGSFTDAEFQNDPLYVPFRVLSPLELHRAGQLATGCSRGGRGAPPEHAPRWMLR